MESSPLLARRGDHSLVPRITARGPRRLRSVIPRSAGVSPIRKSCLRCTKLVSNSARSWKNSGPFDEGDVMRMTSRVILMLVLVAALAGVVVIGQTPSNANPTVLGTGAFTAFVENMD